VLYKAREPDRDTLALIGELEPVINGLGFALIEISLYRGKNTGKAQVRLVVGGGVPQPETAGAAGLPAGASHSGTAGLPGAAGGPSCAGGPSIGTGELARVHRAVLPRLELALEGRDLYLEVSSPGTDRLIKEGAEFRHYAGRAVKCWLSGADGWKHGLLRGSDQEKILLETGEGIAELRYEQIAKARLDG